MPDGEQKKIVIGTDKRGDVMAMDAATGEPIWSNLIGTAFNTDSSPSTEGSGEVWPGTQGGVEAYYAADGNTAYLATSSMGFNSFLAPVNP